MRSSSCSRSARRARCKRACSWWAANHRFHHKHSDTPLDPHSAKQRGFSWAHVGWITAEDYDGTNLDLVGDLAKYPELRLLNRPRIQMLPAVPLALALLVVAASWPSSGGSWSRR